MLVRNDVGDQPQRDVAAGVAELVVHAFEMIDVDHQHGDRPPLTALHQPIQMAPQIALVVQRGQRIGQRQFQRRAEVGAEAVLIELAADLIAGAGAQLVLVDRHRQPVAGAQLEAAQHALALAGFGDQQQRRLVRRVSRAQRRNQLQRVLVGELQADHDQVVGVPCREFQHLGSGADRIDRDQPYAPERA